MASQRSGSNGCSLAVVGTHRLGTTRDRRRCHREHVFHDLRAARQTETVTSEQMAMISAASAVMHGQAVIAGTRVPVSVILDCIAAGMTTEQITAEYPTVTAAGVRAAAAYGAALAREELLPIPQSR
jgi:uncharacterized protein (DUF433 family)